MGIPHEVDSIGDTWPCPSWDFNGCRTQKPGAVAGLRAGDTHSGCRIYSILTGHCNSIGIRCAAPPFSDELRIALRLTEHASPIFNECHTLQNKWLRKGHGDSM